MILWFSCSRGRGSNTSNWTMSRDDLNAGEHSVCGKWPTALHWRRCEWLNDLDGAFLIKSNNLAGPMLQSDSMIVLKSMCFASILVTTRVSVFRPIGVRTIVL